ncbi:murein L,D-transpeptidase [Sphingomonas gilva]|uniref:Murein L,D-transpeptidase n=1 Tax=Sphingomonas gilva TaxID=2305907 RepID=A0A396RRY8_9SPHN|nr:murein L,D-transpeptidase [Sphingomonas gilva]
MYKAFVSVACLGLATAGLVSASEAQNVAAPRAASVSPIDMNVLHVQVILGKLGFSPGVLDGKRGQSLTAALRGFQEARGLKVTGEIDPATLRELHPYRAWRPTRELIVAPSTAKGPFTNPFPDDPVAQSKLSALNYKNLLEKLAEQFHTTPATLVALNGRDARLGAGAKLVFPNALPLSRDYPADLSDQWRATLGGLNVTADQPEAARIVVDKSDGVLRVYDKADKLVAQFPATMGSSSDPLPLGKWTIKGTAYNPTWSYNPDLLKTADQSDPKVEVPPGPNSPVGVVWIDISKPHYGIHGTNEPSTIGRAESNGCIRLTNWDAARLSLMVKPGTPALFQA